MPLNFDIVTPRLRLYAPSLADITALIRHERAELETRIRASIPHDWPGPNLTKSLPSIAEAMALEQGDARWVWLVINPMTAQVIGDIGFHGPLHPAARVEIGYVLEPEARGYGFATEATAALIQWTFAHTNVAQIIAQIDPANAASLRVAAKLGMQPLPALESEYLCFGIARPPT